MRIYFKNTQISFSARTHLYNDIETNLINDAPTRWLSKKKMVARWLELEDGDLEKIFKATSNNQRCIESRELVEGNESLLISYVSMMEPLEESLLNLEVTF